MADTVNKSNQAEKELERRVMQYQIEKEEADARKEERRKEDAKKKLIDIRRTLETQVKEKKLAKDHENFINEVYMQKWMQMAEEDNAKRKQEEELGKKKKLEVKDFLLQQIQGSSVLTSIQTLPAGNEDSPPKVAGKAMNVEELRINKKLLKEISRRKKEK